MFLASLILNSLVIAAPLTTIFDGPIIHGVITTAAAISLATIALRVRPAEATFLLAVTRPIVIVAAIPAFWMLLQVLPLQRFGLAHSIWESAASALGRPVTGRISIDPGATILSLTRYLSAISIAFVAAAVTVDRRRAEWVFFVLVIATTLIAATLLVTGLGTLGLFHHNDSSFLSNGAITAVALGIILATAGGLHKYEHDHAKARKPDDVGFARYRVTFGGYIAALAICSLAFLFGATSQAYFAVLGGIAALIAVFAIRHFDLGLWGIAAIVSAVLFVAAAVVILGLDRQNIGLTLAYAAGRPTPLIEVTQRVLLDAGWAGFGGGTFAAVLPIYRDINELTIGSVAPTAAAAIAVEMGLPFLWAGLIAAVALVVLLLRGALRQQRDWVYSTVGASCGVVVALLALCDASLFSTPVVIIAAVAIGMAIAQSQSRLSW